MSDDDEFEIIDRPDADDEFEIIDQSSADDGLEPATPAEPDRSAIHKAYAAAVAPLFAALRAGQGVTRHSDEIALGGASGLAGIGNFALSPVRVAAGAVAPDSSFTDYLNQMKTADTDLRKQYADSGYFTGGRMGTQVAATWPLGGALANTVRMIPGAARVAPNLLRAIETSGSTGGGLATRALGSAITGGAQSAVTGDNLEDVYLGAALGPLMTIAAPAVIPLAAKGVGRLADSLSGDLVLRRAGRTARGITGENTDQILAALRAADPGVGPLDDLNTAQIVADAGVVSRPFQALKEIARKKDPDYFGNQLDRQRLARRFNIESTKPDLKAALEARSAGSSPLYKDAFNLDDARLSALAAQRRIAAGSSPSGSSPVTPPLNALRRLPVIQAASRTAVKEQPWLGDPMASLRGLHFMKGAIDSQFKTPLLPTELQRYNTRALASGKRELLDAIEGTATVPGISPLYKQARETHALLSKPVDQAVVMDEMLSRLTNWKGDETAAPFANLLGRGEKALLRTKLGAARYEDGDLAKVLTGPQMAAVTQAERAMTRDAQMARHAKEGAQKTAEVLDEMNFIRQLPNPLSVSISLTNRVLDKLQNRLNEKTMNLLVDGMKSGRTMQQILESVPARDRNVVLKTLADMKMGPASANFTNALVQSAMNQQEPESLDNLVERYE